MLPSMIMVSRSPSGTVVVVMATVPIAVAAAAAERHSATVASCLITVRYHVNVILTDSAPIRL